MGGPSDGVWGFRPMIDDEGREVVSLRRHLAFAGAIAGLGIAIAVFLGRYPMECQSGFKLVSTWRTQFCVADPAAR